jgi:hypothetical protein
MSSKPGACHESVVIRVRVRGLKLLGDGLGGDACKEGVWWSQNPEEKGWQASQNEGRAWRGQGLIWAPSHCVTILDYLDLYESCAS